MNNFYISSVDSILSLTLQIVNGGKLVNPHRVKLLKLLLKNIFV